MVHAERAGLQVGEAQLAPAVLQGELLQLGGVEIEVAGPPGTRLVLAPLVLVGQLAQQGEFLQKFQDLKNKIINFSFIKTKVFAFFNLVKKYIKSKNNI